MSTEQARAIALNDLAEMTMRANVVFAVRCAERIRPSFDLPADAPRRNERMAAVDAAIAVAAAFCRGQPGEPGRAAAAALLANAVADETYEITGYAGYAAVRAAEAAACAEEAVNNPSDSALTEVIAAAFGAGRVLASNADAFSLDVTLAALQADVEKLLSLGRRGSEDLGAPIDPSESGPLGSLWPAGMPPFFLQQAPNA